MKIQVLVSTMFQTDYSLLDKLNVQSDAIIINQCNEDGKQLFQYNSYNITWINSSERGLSKSRNLALHNATADICIICDDDERLSDGYSSMVEGAYKTLKKADVIAFNINRVGRNEGEQIFTKPQKIRFFKTYSSVHITFRRKKIVDSQIVFDTQFGTGSDMYLCAEDAIFCMDCHKSGLTMYTFPGVLCDVKCEKSTWFNGYDERYFYDVGAYLATTFPFLKVMLKWYYPIRCRNISKISVLSIISAINKGIKGYIQGMNYDNFMKSKE